MDEHLKKIAIIIESTLDDVFNTNTVIGTIWSYKTEKLNDNNITIEIIDNKKKTHKYNINIEEIK